MVCQVLMLPLLDIALSKRNYQLLARAKRFACGHEVDRTLAKSA